MHARSVQTVIRALPEAFSSVLRTVSNIESNPILVVLKRHNSTRVASRCFCAARTGKGLRL
jgi:hypothetical protein